MSSFHILNLYEESDSSKRMGYMKIKLWTCVITVIIAAVMLRYYAVDYGKQQQTIAEDVVPIIGVLIKNDDFMGDFHECLKITGTGEFYREVNGKREVYPAGRVITEKRDVSGDATEENLDEAVIYGSCDDSGELVICNLKRFEEQPSYRGILKITSAEKGYLVINELSLEEYLPAVVSSEMSASFPEEALKAQAVCARTYAVKRMQEHTDRYYGAILDDSMENQVYNNIHSDAVTKQAVEDTAGMILMEEDAPADIYYYSTSCGATGEDLFDNEDNFSQFLRQGREDDLEKEEAWYRWNASVSSEKICGNLKEMNVEPPGQVLKLNILERTQSGQVTALQIEGTDGSVRMNGEYEIRQALATKSIVLQDGSNCSSLNLLPSAWFVIDDEYADDETEKKEDDLENTVFLLTGGGFGHGIGMSQNGAKCMALAGNTWQEILEAYYPEFQIKNMQRIENIEGKETD